MPDLLPLFPLQTVLFPGMPLHLHVFEPRYRRLIRRSLEGKTPFGVALIRQGMEANGPLPLPYPCGTEARITEFDELPDGHMNVIALGEERFRITNLKQGMPFLVAEVERLTLEWPADFDAQRGVYALTPWLREYFDALSQISQDDLSLGQFHAPTDPENLFFMAAGLLQVPPIEKQPLLELASASDLLTALLRLYRRELSVLKNTAKTTLDQAKKAAENN